MQARGTGAFALATLALAVGACGGDARDEATPSTSTSTAAASTAAATTTDPPPGTADTPAARDGFLVIDMPGAVAVNVTARAGTAAVAWSTAESVEVARIAVATGELLDQVDVSGGIPPFPNAIDRPAIAIDVDGDLHIAFTTIDGPVGSVAYGVVRGGQLVGPSIVSGPPRRETVLVHVTESAEAAPAMAWLEDSSLTVAVPAAGDGGRFVEHDGVDDQTCDCCNPAPLLMGDDLVVAYRDLERNGDEVIRDVVAVRSEDSASTFSPVIPIADEPWFLDACPFSGPDIVDAGGVLVTTWMDARQSLHPDQQSTTIWVDRSVDQGRTFGTDLAITDDGIHRWPMLAFDDGGTIHLVWETQDRDAGGLSHASSSDQAVSFGEPHLLLPDDDESGRRRAPSVAVTGDRLLVTWIDGAGGHLAIIDTATLP